MISSSPRESESSYIHHWFLFLSTLHRCRSLHHLMSSTKGVDAPFVLVDSSSLEVVASSPDLRRRRSPARSCPTRGRSPAARSPAPAPRARASAAAPREGHRRDTVAPPGPSSRPRRPSSRPRRGHREEIGRFRGVSWAEGIRPCVFLLSQRSAFRRAFSPTCFASLPNMFCSFACFVAGSSIHPGAVLSGWVFTMGRIEHTLGRSQSVYHQ